MNRLLHSSVLFAVSLYVLSGCTLRTGWQDTVSLPPDKESISSSYLLFITQEDCPTCSLFDQPPPSKPLSDIRLYRIVLTASNQDSILELISNLKYVPALAFIKNGICTETIYFDDLQNPRQALSDAVDTILTRTGK